ncbi:MAG: Ig-like domain-containing protein [Myxococcota bacterium]
MRRAVVGLLTLVVLVAMVVTMWRYLRAEGRHGQLSLAEVAGEVHLERADGQSVPATRGERLVAEDRVSTGAGGRAVLSLGPQTRVRIGPTSSLRVTGVDEAGVSLELEDGALQATVRPESGAVRVSNRDRAILATNGEVAVGISRTSDGDVLQVNAVRGTLALTGLDATQLEEGQQAVVVDRHAEVGPVPEELLLAVDWPSEARTRAESSTVSGKTQPGARVRLQGAFGVRTVVANADGRFVAQLPLAEGDNPIEVSATDPLGQAATVEGMLQTRDTRGPSFSGGVDYDPP